MNLLKTTSKRLSAVLLLLLAASAPLAAEAPAAGACGAMQQWALDHRAELPTDYAGLLAYPVAQRRAIYGTLSADEKVAVWQDRVAAYLAAHPELSVDQIDAIGAAASFLRPDLFAWSKGANDDPAAEVLKEARAALGDRIVREVFYGLGPAKAAAREGIEGSSVQPLCDCRTWNDCPDTSTNACLNVVGDPCEIQTTGCGAFWSQVCYRQCVWVE